MSNEQAENRVLESSFSDEKCEGEDSAQVENFKPNTTQASQTHRHQQRIEEGKSGPRREKNLNNVVFIMCDKLTRDDNPKLSESKNMINLMRELIEDCVNVTTSEEEMLEFRMNF